MTQSKSLKRTPRFAAAGLALSLCLGILMSGIHGTWTQAAPKHGGRAHGAKLAADLQRTLKDGSHDGRVRVIVEPAGAWSGGLDSELKQQGASVKGSFKNFAARAVEIKADDVEKLAERDDVAYVTPDRQVKLLGHVTLTSGADAAAATGGLSNYDGAGLGLVVMDSGIDSTHFAFADNSGHSRVVYSQDFTGEGRTDDPYGHGTHVASIAAGSGVVASGAYLGVAPAAKIINLRVLDSQGLGATSTVLAGLDWVMQNRNNPAYNIPVVNLSLGTPSADSYLYDPLCPAVG